MAKIYLYSLKNIKKDLSYVGNLTSENDIQQMLNLIFEEEEELLNDDSDIYNEDEDLNEPQQETNMINEKLNIDEVVNLGPWVFIDNTTLPVITRKDNSEDDDDDWDPENLN